MDGVTICTRPGLLYGRHYLWYGTDLLVIEDTLTDDQQRAAIKAAFAEARARAVAACSSARSVAVA